MKLKVTIDSKNYEVDVEVAEPEPAGAPPRFHQTVESSASPPTSVAVIEAPPIEQATTVVLEDKVAWPPSPASSPAS